MRRAGVNAWKRVAGPCHVVKIFPLLIVALSMGMALVQALELAPKSA
jgi:hypothetical protein